MAAAGVLVFDDEPLAVVQGGSGRTFVILEDNQDVLVFDATYSSNVVEGEVEHDFVLFDSEVRVTETVLAPPDFILLDPPSEPVRVVLDGSPDEDLLVLTPGGPPGPAGQMGPQGPQGLPGPGAYYQEFNFASPATTWTVVHNQDSLGLNVETVDTNGDPIEGYVRSVDSNVIEIDWYYPTTGVARVFR